MVITTGNINSIAYSVEDFRERTISVPILPVRNWLPYQYTHIGEFVLVRKPFEEFLVDGVAELAGLFRLGCIPTNRQMIHTINRRFRYSTSPQICKEDCGQYIQKAIKIPTLLTRTTNE